MKNPFRGLRFSLLDFENIRANKGMKVAMVIIAIIPLIYGALYLAAFYDPYNKLNQIPVAVVNDDVPVTASDGSTVNAGQQVVDQMKDSTDGLDWSFVNDEEAQSGLESGKYYMKLIIPSDFSKSIASADSDTPAATKLEMVGNQSNNFLATTLGASVFRVVTSKVNYAIGDDYYVKIFDKIGDSGEDIKTAADGASTLTSGLSDAQDGSQTITDNLVTAQDGSQTLTDGLVTAADGSNTISTNLATATDGAQTLDDGLSQLSDGLATGKVGSTELAAGLHQLQSQGSSKLASGATGLVATLNAKSTDFATLDAGAKQVSGGVTQLDAALSGLSPQLTSTYMAISDTGSTIYFDGTRPSLQAQLNAIESSSGQLTTVAGQLNTDATAAAADATTIQNAMSGLSGVSGDLTDAGTNITAAATSAGTASAYISSAQDSLSGTGSADLAITAAEAKLANGENLTNDDLEAIRTKVTAADTTLTAAKAQADDAVSSDQAAGGNVTSAGTALSSVSSLSATTDDLNTQLGNVKSDLTTISNGSTAMFTASGNLIGDSKTTISGASTMVSGLSSQLGQLKTLDAGAQSVSAGVTELVSSLTTDTYDASGTATSIHAAASQLSDGATQVDSKMSAAASGADQLVSGTNQLYDGSLSAKSGAASLASGLEQLTTGSNTLTKGLVSAKSGSATLTDGLGQLADGSSTLTSGISTAKDGSNELADGLSDGYQTVLDQTSNSDAKASMMSEPVTLDDEPYTVVNNYGTGFAPYFISLGLWVGALMATFIIKPLNKRLICSGANPVVTAFASLAPALLVGLVQSVLLGLTLQFLLKIDVAHVFAFYALIILAAVVFAAISQMLMAVFGFPGKFISILLLMLQLTSAAGTFPLETAPTFFQVINPYLPMTYVVRALRVATTGLDVSAIGPSVGILFLFGGIAFLVTCLAARRKRLVTMLDLHPLVDL